MRDRFDVEYKSKLSGVDWVAYDDPLFANPAVHRCKHCGAAATWFRYSYVHERTLYCGSCFERFLIGETLTAS